MRRLPNGTLYFLLLLVVFAFLPTLLHAQYDACAGIPDPLCDPMDNRPECVCPIDGGLSALIALGLGYGVKKVRDARKSPPMKQVD